MDRLFSVSAKCNTGRFIIKKLPNDITIHNLQGVQVYKGSHSANPATGNLEVDLSKLNQGMYLLRFQGQGE